MNENTDGVEAVANMRYLQYKLHGFETVTLKSNESYYQLDNNPLFKSIHISDDIKKLVVELKNGVTYEGYKNEIGAYVNQLCFNMIIQANIVLDSPHRTLEIIKDKDEGAAQGELIIRDYATFRDKVIIKVLTSADNFYKDVINKETAMDKHFVLYERIFKTLSNPNKVVQFLSLYQFLYDLLGKEKPQAAQKYVTQYIKDRGSKYPHIGFKPSRKHGKDEDDLTYLRNEISHAEDTNDLELYSKLGIEITDSKIKQIIIILNDVLLELP